jgi:hypothetical protein
MKKVFVWALLLLVAGALPSAASAQEPVVSPPGGPPETEFTFSAGGFLPFEEVNYWITPPDNTVLGNAGFAVEANGEGYVRLEWRAPAWAPPGIWLMVARGRESGLEYPIPFEIVVAPGTEEQAAQVPNVEPSSGPPGTTFRFFAHGFRHEERLGYWVNFPNGEIDSDRNYKLEAERGRASWSWQAPGDAPPGYYSMVARGDKSHIERVIFFEVR